MAKEFTVIVGDDIVEDFVASNACVENGGPEGLFKKVVTDAVQEVKNAKALAKVVAEPAIKEADVAVSEKIAEK